jgi:hypothetical protein
MDGTGCGLCLVAGFGFSPVEPPGSATRELYDDNVIKYIALLQALHRGVVMGNVI